MTRVFLDANVYFAGCASPRGASALILQLARQGTIHLVTSRLVLREADRNLRRKSDRRSVEAFRHFLSTTDVTVLPTPDDKVLRRYEAHIHPKDVPVLAAAVEAQVGYLVTLDRKHFLTPAVQTCARDMKILTPGDFLKDILHPAPHNPESKISATTPGGSAKPVGGQNPKSKIS